MTARPLIAFTGGLDSTYVLHEELKKGNKVEVLYANVRQADEAALAELTCRRRILNHFNNLYPGLIVNEWVKPVVSISPANNNREVRKFQLVQQANTLLALLDVAMSSLCFNYQPMTGWHREDVREYDVSQYTRTEHLDFLKNAITPFMELMDPLSSGSRTNITTPAWDVSKYDMWVSLDEWTQVNICLDHTYSVSYDNGRDTLLTQHYLKTLGTKKFAEYQRMGINIRPGVHASFDLLTTLDRFYLARIADQYSDNSILSKCKETMNTLINIPALHHAVDLCHLGRVQSILRGDK